MSTRRCPAVQALRTRVSISATGSVMLMSSPSPAGFAHAGDFSPQRTLAEANAAQFELGQRAAAAAAALAAVIAAHFELWLPFDLLDPALLRHPVSPSLRRPGTRPGTACPARAAAPAPRHHVPPR